MEIIINGENSDLFLEKDGETYGVYSTLNTLWYDYTRGHDFVEIGGIKWATMNVGATGITGYGLYFQWGDTSGYTSSQVGSGSGKKPFYWDDYKYFTTNTSEEGDAYSSGKITKYNSIDNNMVLDSEDDAVRAAWGGSWRMPTSAEFKALGEAVDYINQNGSIITGSDKRIRLNGVIGVYVADKTDNSKRLFFPAAGYFANGGVNDVGSFGYYWSSTLNGSDTATSKHTYFGTSWGIEGKRCVGLTVRGVLG